METGNGIMRNIQEEVHATLVSYLGDMWALQAIHIVLLVLTLLMCAG